ncbi:DNA-binding protein [Vreelandella alkaliphila]|uniref:methylation-associated defense system helix-turn-helix domain-containing protein MAD1 n=1 Tax=Vreelandella alkaliphila TaxID=272774 RepID=UPI000EA199D1|nr:helix-turn-helix domain-containing protein [Halomonas alkaliphila]AYF34274.1 DNA-binding protein [Halomonas alkaliphila]
MPSNSESGILTIKEVAEYLKVTERTIYRLAAAKKIPGFKVGGMWRFRQADIDDWIAAQYDVVDSFGKLMEVVK